MRILILSRNASLYSTERLVETAERRGHEVIVRDPLKFTIQLGTKSVLSYGGSTVVRPDIVIPRIGASVTGYGLAVLRQLEQLGARALNPSESIACSRDKFRALQILATHEIPMPKTVFVRRRQDIIKAIESVGDAPVVIKLLEGTQGLGVVMAHDRGTALALVELMQVAKQNILIQKFIEESRGEDIRAFVVGSRVVASIKRRSSSSHEFRANIHQGGTAENIDLNDEVAHLAVRAAQVVGLKVAGVDLLMTKKGPLVIEVNSSPGLEAIERTSGIDIAKEIIEACEKAS